MQRIPAPVIMDARIIYNLPGCGDFCTLATTRGIIMKYYFVLCALFVLVGCNSVYVKPASINPEYTFYADRGGYGMRRSIKEKMQERGYRVVVGRATTSRDAVIGTESIEWDSATIPTDARYVVKVAERRERFNPFWCPFNGFWWWNFNVSVADQKTGEEIMTWRGRACQNSALRMLDDILDKMEEK